MSGGAFDISMLISRILGTGPFMLMGLVGVVLYVIRESRPLRVRVAVGSALTLAAIDFVFLPLLYGSLVQRLDPGAAPGRAENAYLALNLVSSSISAMVYGLILYAAFTHDDRPASGSA